MRKIERVERLVFLAVPLTAVFTLLIAGTFGLAITRSITQPLARLVEGSKALARATFSIKSLLPEETNSLTLGGY